MNKTRIEWCDYTWNPVTGCKHGCSYCYARKVAKRFYPPEIGFEPHLWKERLKEPIYVSKPSKIFVSSMGDLFGEWVSPFWYQAIFETVRNCPHHTFQFLTKNPKRMKDFNPWPENCWVGTTVTNQADADDRLPWLLQVEAPVRFVSHEPLMENIFMRTCLANPRFGLPIHWAIIGAMTGPGAVKPEKFWVDTLVSQYQAAGVPIFLKNNLKPVACEPFKITYFPQEWPHV